MCQYGGGQVVSMLDFYSDDPSSNPLKPTVFSVKFVLEKTENKQKEAMVCPFFLKKHVQIGDNVKAFSREKGFFSSRGNELCFEA